MLHADLAETQSILQRLVHAPAFTAELEKITNLQGTGQGKLTLGDSLHDIKAKVEVSEIKLSADHQGVPWPITIAQGQFTFGKKQLDLDTFSGSLGQSQFADLSCRFLWEKDLTLDIGSGRFDLDMAELYPWLASLEGLRDKLQKVERVTGRLALSALAFQRRGRQAVWVAVCLDRHRARPLGRNERLPGHHQHRERRIYSRYPASDLRKTPDRQPGCGTHPVRQSQRLSATARADRTLSLDGSMGPQSVEWLSDRLKVPESYAIHAPLSISKAQISWQPDSTTSFKGLVAIEKGPAITADVDYRPEQLQVNQLHIKDQYSDAGMVFDLNKEQHEYQIYRHIAV